MPALAAGRLREVQHSSPTGGEGEIRMAELSAFLVHQLLRGEFAPVSVLRQGRHLYVRKMVRLVSVEPQKAKAIVKDGSREYSVHLVSDSDNGINVRCHCKQALVEREICPHIVAAFYALHDHLRAQLASTPGALRRQWVDILRRLVPARRPSKHHVPLWPVFSLARDEGASYGTFTPWSLTPYGVPLGTLKKRLTDSGFGDDALRQPDIVHEVLAAYDLWSHVKVLRRRDIPALAPHTPDIVIMVVQLLITWGQDYFFYGFVKDQFVETCFLLLSQAPEVPLYGGTPDQPFQYRLTWLPAPLSLTLELSREDGKLRAQWHLQAGTMRLGNVPGEEIEVVHSARHQWVIVGRRYFGHLIPLLSAEAVQEALSLDELTLDDEEAETFLDDVLPAVATADGIELAGSELEWEVFEGTLVPRLYLFEEEGELRARLRFGYGEYEVDYDKQLPIESLVRKPGTLTLVRLRRDPQAEQHAYKLLSSHGLKRGSPPGLFLLRKNVKPVDFLIRHVPRLLAAGYEVYGEERLKSVRVNRNRPTISLFVSSGIDWFDVQAVVKFGDVPVSLAEVRRALRRRQRYVKLADGSIGEIPAEWIKRYRHLFELGEVEEERVRLGAHHALLLEELAAESDAFDADARFRERLQRLKDFTGIEPRPVPQGFTGELRPYQKAGYDWLHFLHEYEFGGCLADDMGLGKTVQVLAFLLSLRESGHVKAADLIVVPRSLLVNWEREAARFTPSLRVLVHAGAGRTRSSEVFDHYDLVVTTYGLVLRDLELLRAYHFHYVVLDESQAIKNPAAKTSRAVRLLRSDHRLALTGTPVENSSLELWAQFAFLNPGLLGNLEYFKREFAGPIERHNDHEAAQLLQRMVHPFILRRTKEQVAPELPPRTERVLYCDMEPAQRRLYERWRDRYRAIVLGLLDEAQSGAQVRMKILEGLLRLRQIAIHPLLVEEKFRGRSAKMELLAELLETLRAEGHKALIFSQFVQVLKLVRQELDRQQVPYAYLDGRTRKRQAQVDLFQHDPSVPFFLISLKAGGLGLNLTAADYVIHIDPWWNPAVEAQAADRTHRIGQEKPVFIYKLITRDTVEEKILQLQERKRQLVDQLITTDRQFLKTLSREEIEMLFASA